MVEVQPISIGDKENKLSKVACSKANHDGAHSLDIGKPLSAVDFRLYQLALVEEGGVPLQDARRITKEIKSQYNSGNLATKQYMAELLASAWEGLMGSGEMQPVRVSTLPTEGVIFQRSR